MAVDGQVRLVLWDIDYTLIQARGFGRDIYARVFPQVTGQPLRELCLFDGRTELEIIHGTLALHGITAHEEIVNGLAAALADGFRNAFEELITRGSVLPGVHAALESLAAEQGTHQSVLTGNTAEVARIKIDSFGLGQHLDLSIGAYGDDHRDRAELVTIARKRASARLGIPVDADQVVLIGDTPNDVAAARTTGAHIIAVATGSYSVADLAAAGRTPCWYPHSRRGQRRPHDSAGHARAHHCQHLTHELTVGEALADEPPFRSGGGPATVEQAKGVPVRRSGGSCG